MKLGYPPDYVMNDMEFYEIAAVMQYSYLKERESWEQARLIAYVIAQVNSTKPLKITDIMKFGWDNDEKKEAEKISEEKIDALRKRADEMMKRFNS